MYSDISRKSALTLTVLGILGSGSASAGMTDPATGETCWGTGCLESDERPPGGSGTGPAPDVAYLPHNVTTKDCSTTDSRRIGFAVEWLQDNLGRIDATMQASDELMSWPGNSRENFADKLEKDLKFVCIDQKNKCNDLWGITYPVFAQQRVYLCAANINAAGGGDATRTDALYIHVVAHEIGHLIRLNTHQFGCRTRYTDGSFSDALGLAAEYAFLGRPYTSSDYEDVCAGLVAGSFDLEDKLNGMDRPILSEK